MPEEGATGTLHRQLLFEMQVESVEVQQQDKKQSLQDINNPAPVEKEPRIGKQPEPSPL